VLVLQDAEFVGTGGLQGRDEILNDPSLLDHDLLFESYGVTVRLQASDSELLSEAVETASKALVGRVKIVEGAAAEHVFGFSSDESGTIFLSRNGEHLASDTSRQRFFRFFNSILRISVAEYARESVFIHAGVVGWQGKAIIIPANSFAGKTTLVAELVRNGAAYYSDEYAVLDEDGLVHPFPRDLSIRDSAFNESDVPVAEFGGKAATEPIPVGVVVITEFAENSRWEPVKLTVGQGILELIPHTIPRNFNTKFALKVLNSAISDAIILKSPRGEASDLAINLLSFFDNYTDVAKVA
jgi:hypothetical protein